MKHYFWLFILFLISLFLRLYKLGELPVVLNRDEAALAYNAYLLSDTGKDEWQRTWPLSLESFGDYKLPGYVWSLIPLFKVYTHSDYLVRLPSAIAGASLVILAFFFARVIRLRKPWAWLFAILVATTPVFFFYSRMAFEANLALSLFVTAFILILAKAEGIKRLIFDLLAILLTLVAVFTYNTPLLLLPFLLPVIVWIRGFKFWKNWRMLVFGLGIVMILAFWQLLSLSSQKSGVTIFNDETVWINSINYRQQFSGLWQSILGNKYVYYAFLVLQNYVASFSHTFLVQGTANHPWHSLPGHGHILEIVYVFGIIGVLSVIAELVQALKKYKFPKKTRLHTSLLYLLLVSLLPAVVTIDAPHATRSLLFFFFFNIFTLFGLKNSYHLIRDYTQIKKHALFLIFSILLIITSFSYFKGYFTQYSQQQQVLKPGLKEALKEVENKYPGQEIAFIDPEGYDYILLAWYLKVNPEEFFNTVVRQLPDKIGFRYGQQVGRYHFIAQLTDRSETEEIVINWQSEENKWEILEF